MCVTWREPVRPTDGRREVSRQTTACGRGLRRKRVDQSLRELGTDLRANLARQRV